jgi:glycine betaine catabolism B
MLFVKNNPLAAYIDRTGMYTVVIHALIGIIGLALWSSFLGDVYPKPHEILVSILVIVTTALVASVVIAKALSIEAQHASSFISALILVCLYSPSAARADLIAMGVVTLCVVASKYLLVFRKQHLLNPVAIGAVIATPVMFLPLLVLGGIVVTKVHKWPMVGTFLAVGFAVYLFESYRIGSDVTQYTVWSTFCTSNPALFLGALMLTEPFTMPGRRLQQVGYAALVAFLSNTSLLAGLHVAMTPELSLVVANIAF